MGYTTDFSGSLTLTGEITEEQINYINKFSNTRRMARNISKLMELYNGKYGHPTPKSDKPEDIYGNEGEYFVGDKGDFGQHRDDSILDYNTPPNQALYPSGSSFQKQWNERERRIKEGVCQPGLWCQWIIDENEELVWDGGEKFYNYVEWLKYLIYRFFEPWGIKLNGEIRWRGEDFDDIGKIIVKNNDVQIKVLEDF